MANMSLRLYTISIRTGVEYFPPPLGSNKELVKLSVTFPAHRAKVEDLNITKGRGRTRVMCGGRVEIMQMRLWNLEQQFSAGSSVDRILVRNNLSRAA